MLQLNFSPFPTLETERLVLRRISFEHSTEFFKLRSDEVAMKYIDRPRLKSMEECNQLIKKMDDGIEQNAAIVWAITLKDSPGMIGTISFHRIEKENYRAEIGYMLFPKYFGRGLMTEAITTVIDYGFNKMNLHSIEANINVDNNASRQLLKKFGFVQEAYFRENYYFAGKFLDSEIYSLLKPT